MLLSSEFIACRVAFARLIVTLARWWLCTLYTVVQRITISLKKNYLSSITSGKESTNWFVTPTLNKYFKEHGIFVFVKLNHGMNLLPLPLKVCGCYLFTRLSVFVTSKIEDSQVYLLVWLVLAKIRFFKYIGLSHALLWWKFKIFLICQTVSFVCLYVCVYCMCACIFVYECNNSRTFLAIFVKLYHMSPKDKSEAVNIFWLYMSKVKSTWQWRHLHDFHHTCQAWWHHFIIPPDAFLFVCFYVDRLQVTISNRSSRNFNIGQRSTTLSSF